ncbi:hypothetical protein [Arthrobacter sp. efr-133-TYG-118]|uniref:hypothetical protein n=1 Tax=Arthrobacter sp. efr-133-TYG-118 TaxID=3040279 RepID=UPI00254E3DF9|nr:hypothetical protein [Arthrobacter sp. efr-133-TYG-118]
MDAEARRLHFRAALENAHKDIVMASARLELIGTAPAADDGERWERARAAVKILQRAV